MPDLVKIKKHHQLTGHKAAVFALGPAPGGQRFFLSGAGDGWLVSWDLDETETGRLVARVETQIFSMLYIPESHQVVVGNMQGGVHWVDLDHPEQTRNIAHHHKGVFDLLRVGDSLFSVGGGGMLTRWSLSEKRSLESVHLSNQSLRCLGYCPSRQELAVGASDNNIYLIDPSTMTLRHIIRQAHNNSVFTVRYTPGGDRLLSGGRDAHLRAWDPNHEFAPISAQPAHWFTINDIAFHPEGHYFATASRDKTIKIWDTATLQLIKVLNTARDSGHLNSVNKLYWSPYRQFLISGSDDRSLIVWKVE